MLRSRSWHVLLASTLALALAACGDDDTDPPADTGAGDSGDADVGEDGGDADVSDDAAGDVATDTEPDVVEDTAGDVPDDAEPDNTIDADATTDATADATDAADFGDTGGDAADGEGDASDARDLGADTPDDSGGDAAVDSGADAEDVGADGADGASDRDLDLAADADAAPDAVPDLTEEPDAGPDLVFTGPIFVDPDPAFVGDGSSWDLPLDDLEAAVALAESTGRVIWIKEGTLRPSAPNKTVLEMFDGLEVYGGFDERLFGRGGSLETRRGADRTVLDGDLDGVDENRAWHVVVGAPGAVLDGLDLRGGRAAGSEVDGFGGCLLLVEADGMVVESVTMTDCVSAPTSGAAFGGALYCEDSEGIVLNTVTFSDSAAYGPDGVAGASGAGRAHGGAAAFVRCDGALESAFFSTSLAQGGAGAPGIGGDDIGLDGGDALGGCLFLSGSDLPLTTVETSFCAAIGGDGGVGAAPGERGGNGGSAFGGGVAVLATPFDEDALTQAWTSYFSLSDAATGGAGGDGAPVAAAGDCVVGGDGGLGGNALGGAVYTGGVVQIRLALGKIEFAVATAGAAGDGGAGSGECEGGVAGRAGTRAGGCVSFAAVEPIVETFDLTGCSPDLLAGPLAWFVDPAAEDGGDGASWDSAFTDFAPLELALFVEPRDVWVRTGTIASDGEAPVLTMASGVDVYGSFSAGLRGIEGDPDEREELDGTVLDGADSSLHVVVGASDARLSGVVITGGSADGAGTDGSGGGLLLVEADGFTLSGVDISENAAQGGFGGGVYCADSDDVVFENVRVLDNQAVGPVGPELGEAGDAAWGGGIYAERCVMTLVDTSIGGNVALGGAGAPDGGAGGAAFGAGLAARDSSLHLEGLEVTANSVLGGVGGPGGGALSGEDGAAGGNGGNAFGGGVFITTTGDSVTIADQPWTFVVSENQAFAGTGGPGENGASDDPCTNGGAGGNGGSAYGGGLLLQGAFDLVPEASSVTDNTALGGVAGPGGAAGGAGCVAGSSGDIGAGRGGGIYADGVALSAGAISLGGNTPTDLEAD